MKKVIFFALFCTTAFFSSTSCFAQNVIKANIFSPLVRTGSFFYERGLTENKSFQMGFLFTGFKSDGTHFSGFGITPEFRFYLSATDAPKGVYVGPYLRYQSFTVKDDASTSKGSMNTLGGGVSIGKQWIFKDRISLDAFVGPGYNNGSIKVESGENKDFNTGAFRGFTVRPGLTFGVKF